MDKKKTNKKKKIIGFYSRLVTCTAYKSFRLCTYDRSNNRGHERIILCFTDKHTCFSVRTVDPKIILYVCVRH